MTYLTERQKAVLEFIHRHLAEHGVAPTLQEIADHFGFRSTASAQKHIALLEHKGFLRRDKHQKRGLILATPPASFAPALPPGRLPLVGTVAAGSPIESFADDAPVEVPVSMLRGGDHYVLRVRGDSMIDDGIHDGDLVVVRQTATARDGDTVVALLESEATLKRFFRDTAGMIRLQPANPSCPVLVVPAARVQVQGVVVGLLRHY